MTSVPRAGCYSLLVFLLASPTEAAEAFTSSRVSLAAEVGYGIYLGNSSTPSPYAFALGARGGYTLPYGAYVGGRFDYFFGDSNEEALTHSSSKSWDIQAELGYDLGLSERVVLRPKIGAGVMHLGAEVCLNLDAGSGCTTGSSTAGVFAVGAELPVTFWGLTVAPEARFNFWMGKGSATGLHLGLLLGATF